MAVKGPLQLASLITEKSLQALAGELMQRSGAGGGFAGYLDTVRAKHRAKRNFMQRIERLAAPAE